MSHGYNPDQLVCYQEYLGSLEELLQTTGPSMHPLELESIRLSLADIGNILDQDIAATAKYLGSTSVDPSLKVG